MKNYKRILQYSVSILLLIIFFFFRVKSVHTKYQPNDEKFEGIILSYQIDGSQLKMELFEKEKLLIIYYFKNEQEKLNFSNEYHLGDTLLLKGNLELPSSNRNFHLFNYQKYLKGKKIFWILKATQIKKVKESKNSLFLLKETIQKRVRQSDHSNYLSYFLLGDSSEMDVQLLGDIRSLGVSHLFAISGMHIHLLTGILLLFLKKVTRNQGIHLIILTIFLIFYSFLTQFSPSVIRASIFFILLFFRKLFSIPISSTTLLWLIAVGMLIYYPFYLYHLGFIFSFVISFSLLYFSKYLNKKSYLKSLWQTSFISFFMGVPILLKCFNTINFLTPFWNLIFVPFISFFIFPLCVFSFFLPILNPILEIGVSILEKLVHFGDSFSFLTFSFHTITLPIFLIYFVIIIWALIAYFKKNYKPFFFLLLLLIIHYFIAYYNPHPIINMIDVEQGDSILIELPHQKGNILIDTGGQMMYQQEAWKRKKKNFSIGESILIPYLRSLGIHHLDYLILTHGDADHMKEAIYLINHFKVKDVIFNCGPYNDLEKELVSVLDKKNIKYYSCIKELNIDKYKLQFLNTGTYDNENDNSNVIYFNYNNYKFLFMGDAGTIREKDILEKYNLNNIDFLKVGHHGSNTSSSKYFIDSIHPHTCLISVGADNRYGHPKKSVLEILNNCNTYRTDINGGIEIKLKNNDYSIKTVNP